MSTTVWTDLHIILDADGSRTSTEAVVPERGTLAVTLKVDARHQITITGTPDNVRALFEGALAAADVALELAVSMAEVVG